MPSVCLLSALLLAAVQPSDAEIRHQAEAAYRAGIDATPNPGKARKQFARAAELFEDLRRRGVRNAALDINRGQAYLLAGDLPRAILAYRAGLRLAPNHATLRQRLEEARQQVAYTTPGSFGRPAVDNWPPWLPRLAARGYLILVLLFYSVACLALMCWRIMRRGGYLALALSALVVGVLPAVGLIGEASERQEDRNHPLVVISASRVVLHKGDGRNYPCYDASGQTWHEVADGIPVEATPLPRGVEARLRFDRGDWLQIELSGGEIGWVRRGDVVLDVPS